MPLSVSVPSPTALTRLSSTISSNQLPTPIFRALTLSTSLPHGGDWLNVIPSSTLGLHLQDKKFRCCLQYWQGLRMTEEGAICPICQGVANAYGAHQV